MQWTGILSLGLLLAGQLAAHSGCSNVEDSLLSWLRANAGFAHIDIGSVTADALRGVIAATDVKKGASLALLPDNLIIEMGSQRHSSAENAAVLLGKHAKDAQWHRMMSPYWDSLPGTDSGLLCRHLFTEHEAAMLQSASMKEEIEQDQEHLRQVFYGTAQWWEKLLGLGPRANLVKESGAQHNVTLQAFAHAACLVGAYAFACQRGSWPFHYSAICLLPVMDMLNHRAGNGSNAIVDQNKNGSYGCYAKRAIQAGEEVTQTYSRVTSRMDHSLLQYGFVEEHDEPLLAAVDSATGFEHEDDSLYGQHAHLTGPEELRRLRGILESLETSEEQDRALLADTRRGRDGRIQAILRFRIQRKVALKQMIKRLEKGPAMRQASSSAKQEL